MSDQGLQGTRSDTEAADWFARLKARQVSARTLREFQAWRRGDGNDAAYRKVEATWAAAAALAQAPEIQAATQAVEARPPPKPTVTWTAIPKGPAILGVSSALVLGMGAWLWSSAAGQTFATRIGEQKLVRLDDGSQVRLNTDSRVRVRFRKDVREVELVRGEAFFEAAHDARRPFVVEAADTHVRAIGTKFDVRRQSDGVWVALVEGKVHVDQTHGAAAAVLQPDQQVTATARGISAPSAVDAAQSTSWTRGRLTLHDIPLSEAIAQVNRYTSRKVVLDAPIGDARVTGVFNTGDTPAFIAAVTAYFDLRAQPAADGDIHLVRRAPPPAE
jgi:transmembrane sensor